MFISRFWTLLLVISGALLLTVVMLARDLVNRERQEYAGQSIFTEREKIEVAFTLYARKRMDVLLAVSADEEVRKLVAEADISSAKRGEVRPKLLSVLSRLNSDLNQYKADMLLALDSSGMVIVQEGRTGRENEFSLAGLPAVDAALRGYVRDDVWKLGNEVFKIAARPVIHNNRYVGAVVHAVSMNDQLAALFSSTSQVGFYMGQIVTAIGKPANADFPLARDAAVAGSLSSIREQKQYEERGRTEAIRFMDGDQSFVGVFSKVRGTAALNDVGWFVLIPVSSSISITAVYEEAGTQDIENLPLVMISVGAVLALLLGWFWNYLEAERPVSKLYRAVSALETADVKDQLNVYKFKRNLRRIAQSFNKVIDVKIRETLGSMSGGGKSVNTILGEQDSVRLSSAAFRFSEDLSDDVPAPPPAALNPPPPDAKPRLPSGGIQPTPPAGAPRMPTKPQKPVSLPGSATSAITDPSEDEGAYFRQIHSEFIEMKQRLGESVEGLTFDRFEGTLKKNRDMILSRYGCASVRFTVYEKDGKASLKAVPFTK